MKIVGVSFNTVQRNDKWAKNQEFQYEVWSDSKRELGLALGAASKPDQGSPRRVTRVLDAEGRVILAYDKVSVMSDPQTVLDDYKALTGQ